MDYVLLAIGWSLFGAVHSFLASTYWKALVNKPANRYTKYYRIVYNGIALVTFLAPLYYQWHIEKAEILSPNLVLTILGVGVAGVGVGIALLALSQYNLAEFSGLDAFRAQEQRSHSLQSTRLLSRVRHPLYTGTLLLLWGSFLLSPTIANVVMAVFLSTYIRVGIYFEERKLLREFGEEYRRYKERVPMLFPSIQGH